MTVFLLFALALSPVADRSPSVPPAGQAHSSATVTIMRPVEVGHDLPPPAITFQLRNETVRLADGTTRPMLTYELE